MFVASLWMNPRFERAPQVAIKAAGCHTGRMPPTAERLTARLPVKAWITHARLILALKTALAVGLAWLIAPLVPGVAEEYPYYAPLGALISMSTTLMSSVRTGVGTLVGLALGIVLAGAVIILASPNVFTISLVVGVGVLISGSRFLKSGGEYVPVAALFVLIIGGPNADSYSIGYLVQMSVGIAVGLAVNFLILPPITIGTAVVRLQEFRELLAQHLNEMSEALVESWPPEHENWATRSDLLRETADGVREALSEADESRKGNPRARLNRRNRRNLDNDYSDLYDLESVTFHVRNITDVLAASIWERAFYAELSPEMCKPLSEVLASIADMLIAHNTDDTDAEREAITAADAALHTLLDQLDRRIDNAPTSQSAAAAVAMDARRILAIARPESSKH
jgi:uncharacterized membrane protein YgaE (UPF0421/DUF939 family)